MGVRSWVEAYRASVQNKELIDLSDRNLKVNPAGPWAFLKLAFLWSYAYHTYTPIIGKRYVNMCYADLFAGSGLNRFSDRSGKAQFILGSPLLMATIGSKYPFKKCFFFENDAESARVLDDRLKRLKSAGKLTCQDYKCLGDCNNEIGELVDSLCRLNGCHYLLFVDPFSTEIHWPTMEKLLKLNYPAFDMVFNFQPFGVNRKSYDPQTTSRYFGDEDWRESYQGENDKTLDTWESHYIQRLKRYPNKVGTIRTIRIRSGTGGFYYDLIYTTRKEAPPWVKGIDHLKLVIEQLTGYDVSIIVDPTFPSLDGIIRQSNVLSGKK